MMEQPISPLVVQLLEWISRRPRTYAETMDAWRSTCPRLTIWEDAWIAGLVQIEPGSYGTDKLTVSLTAVGRSVLAQHSAQSQSIIDGVRCMLLLRVLHQLFAYNSWAGSLQLEIYRTLTQQQFDL
jgi:hypothetical protein